MPKFKAGDRIERNGDGIKATVSHISRGASPRADRYILEVKEGGSCSTTKTWDVDRVETYWDFEKTKANPTHIQASSISTGRIELIGNPSAGSVKTEKTLSYEVYGEISQELQSSIFQLKRVKGSSTNSGQPDKLVIHTDIPTTVTDANFLRALVTLAPEHTITRKVVV